MNSSQAAEDMTHQCSATQRSDDGITCTVQAERVVESTAEPEQPGAGCSSASPMLAPEVHQVVDGPMRLSVQCDAPSLPSSAPSSTAQPELRTTLMLRNVPKNHTREMLLAFFDSQGFCGQYDFVFLPIDFGASENRGYALVNLISNPVAARLWEILDDFSGWQCASEGNEEACEVSWNSLQGIEAHVECYRNSPLMHGLVPDECKPATFVHGVRCPFPPPTTRLELPEEQGDAVTPRQDPNGGAATPIPARIVDVMSQTTLMLKNLPQNYTREMMLGLFDNFEFCGQYDFILLPIDFKTHQNRGYAHVNFVSHAVAAQFWDTFNGFSRWWSAWYQEVCEISWAPLQGLDANIERYRNSPLIHERVPDEFKPVIFAHGVRMPFPPPTQKVRPPRIRGLGLAHKMRGYTFPGCY